MFVSPAQEALPQVKHGVAVGIGVAIGGGVNIGVEVGIGVPVSIGKESGGIKAGVGAEVGGGGKNCVKATLNVVKNKIVVIKLNKKIFFMYIFPAINQLKLYLPILPKRLH